MELPKSGQVRVRFITGKVSDWQPANDVELHATAPVLLCRGDKKDSAAAVFVPLTSILLVEYATDEEVKAMKDEAAKKAAAKSRQVD